MSDLSPPAEQVCAFFGTNDDETLDVVRSVFRDACEEARREAFDCGGEDDCNHMNRDEAEWCRACAVAEIVRVTNEMAETLGRIVRTQALVDAAEARWRDVACPGDEGGCGVAAGERCYIPRLSRYPSDEPCGIRRRAAILALASEPNRPPTAPQGSGGSDE